VPDEFRVATPRVAAGVLIRDDVGRVLLVKPTYKEGWDIPGGYVEPGESPKSAAAREVEEELGLSRPIGRLLVVDWAPHPDEGDKLLFIYDGGDIGSDLDRVALREDEIAQIEFVALRDAGARLPQRILERLKSAMDLASDAYLEHGRRTS
jgi:8-oxo-dGTP pyrophosphatase MutT (NUDIX family)